MVAYQREALTDTFIAELEPLLREHFGSMKIYEGYKFNADWMSYRILEEAGHLVIFTAREGDALIGYDAYALHNSMHCRDMKQAIQDLVFVTPRGRKGFVGYTLLKFADAYLEGIGVNRIIRYTPIEDGFGPILKRQGYALNEQAYMKDFDQWHKQQQSKP